MDALGNSAAQRCMLSALGACSGCRRAGAALQCWQPAVVRNHHEQVLAQRPIEVRAPALLLQAVARYACTSVIFMLHLKM